MKKKNGFTLIELLAIIVILAIIAVITIPIILNIIDESKKGAVSDSAYGYKDAIQKFYVSRLSSNPDFEIVNGIYTIDSNGNLKYEDSSDSSKNVLYEINLNGSIPNGGFVEMHNNVLKNACIQFDELSVLITDSVVSEVKSGSCFNVSVISDEDLTIDVGTVYDFNYVSDSDNKEQVLDILQSGYYKLEVWGAQGGSSVYNSTGGYGGYSVGTIKLKKGDRLFINVGGAGVPIEGADVVSDGGYNGGGAAFTEKSSNYRYSGSGGGATHIAFKSGVLSELESEKGDFDESAGVYRSNVILIVAGGGSGTWNIGSPSQWETVTAGQGGGATGKTGIGVYGGSQIIHGGGTQNSGFAFGQGQPDGPNGAGGGFYGGESGGYASGGGSGYIGSPLLVDKIMYCYNCDENDGADVKTISTIGHSGLVDTANCLAGYSSAPIAKCAKAESGFARITYLGYSI